MKDSNNPDVSIVIVNWNSKVYVKKCIQSIYDHDPTLNAQIIVVDGASFDGCEKILKEQFPNVEYIQLMENIGFGKSNNIGAKHAKGKILILLNPDTELHNDSLSKLSRQLEELPNAGLIGPRLLNTDGSIQESSVHAFPTPINQSIDSRFLRRLFPKSKLWNSHHALHAEKPTEVQALSGACIVTYTNFFNKIGGFSPEFFMYSEDIDLSYKSKQAGKTNYHIPNIEITHYGGGSSGLQYSQFSTIAPRDSICIYFDKNNSSTTSYRYKICMTISALIRLPILHLKRALSSNKNNTNAAIKRWNTILIWSFHFNSHKPKSNNAL